ncbi:hypothetical protein NS14008_15410 [Nocardia seriolae]|nr:hypothetical protein NS14008_15410 [Nocardia seriolae]
MPGSPVPSATTPTSAPATDFGYQPLWPFGSVGQAIAWQREANPGGHQPWHLDAGEIAQMFTRQYLGYSGVDKVVKVSTQGEQAWVSVGFDNTNGVAAVAAVLHLARIGEGAANEKPWEVVGSQDATLSLTTPAYGATVRTPVTVGGKITGVDESLRVRILGLGHDRPLGEVTGIPAGGTDTPWTATLPFAADCPATLTLAVSTGGHIAEVERFAVTGVRC